MLNEPHLGGMARRRPNDHAPRRTPRRRSSRPESSTGQSRDPYRLLTVPQGRCRCQAAGIHAKPGSSPAAVATHQFGCGDEYRPRARSKARSNGTRVCLRPVAPVPCTSSGRSLSTASSRAAPSVGVIAMPRKRHSARSPARRPLRATTSILIASAAPPHRPGNSQAGADRAARSGGTGVQPERPSAAASSSRPRSGRHAKRQSATAEPQCCSRMKGPLLLQPALPPLSLAVSKKEKKGPPPRAHLTRGAEGHLGSGRQY